MYRREKQRGTVRVEFIVLLHRKILGGRIFLTVEGPPCNKLLKKRHTKHVQEGKTKRYCTRQVYRPLAPRYSGRTHFPYYCRRTSRQQTSQETTQDMYSYRREKQRGTLRGKFIVLLNREILGGRIFRIVDAPPGKILFNKKQIKQAQEGKTKRYCTRQIYRPLAPRNSGRKHFPYCRSASRQYTAQEKTRQNMYRREKQRGTARGMFIVLLHREILDGRIFLTVEGPSGNKLLKKKHKKHVQERKTKRYCTRQIYRPLAPRNSGRTHFPYCRSASRQNSVQEMTQKTCAGGKNKEVLYKANSLSSCTAKFWADAFSLLL